MGKMLAFIGLTLLTIAALVQFFLFIASATNG